MRLKCQRSTWTSNSTPIKSTKPNSPSCLASLLATSRLAYVEQPLRPKTGPGRHCCHETAHPLCQPCEPLIVSCPLLEQISGLILNQASNSLSLVLSETLTECFCTTISIFDHKKSAKLRRNYNCRTLAVPSLESDIFPLVFLCLASWNRVVRQRVQYGTSQSSQLHSQPTSVG